MNSITVAGQLGKDSEVRFLPNGETACSFSVADSQGKDKDTIWWACSLYGKRAESLSQYLTKGQAVTVTGTVTQRKYTDKNGQERTSMDLRVNDVALQGGKRDAEPSNRPSHDAAKARQVDQPRQAAPRPASGFDDMDDDIPF
jgi:single-strand DNA-binding protein